MDDVENDYPVYGQVDEIIVWEDEKFFILTELATLSFHHHFMAYEVERTDHKAVVLRHDLQWYGVLLIVQKNGKKFIVEKDTCCIEDVLQWTRVNKDCMFDITVCTLHVIVSNSDY